MPFSIEDQYQQYLYPESLGPGSGNGPNYNPAAYVIDEKRGFDPNTSSKIGNHHDVIKVLILDNPSKINKKLLKFFANNIDILNRSGMLFEWIVVYEDEMEQYEEQDITEFPLLVFKNEQVIGADSIIDYLLEAMPEEGKKTIRTNRRESGSGGRKVPSARGGANSGGADADIRNYFLKELDNRQEDDADEDDVFASTVTQRVAAMNKARQLNGQPTLKMSNPEIHERTARAASRQHNYRFDDNAQNYDNSLQSAMSTARKQTERHRRNPARNDNLDFDDPAEDEPRGFSESGTTSGMPSTVDIAKSTSNGTMDDELMLRYWENNTESESY